MLADFSGKLIATGGAEDNRDDIYPLRANAYFRMGDEPSGSDGGTDSYDPVFVP